ncbi:Na+/H+ antiporter NhaC family protein [Neolewinella lacunae]|uniref:Sodium:solute symporter n=1 Tax=Neolewinella lacunae TaxID=1517758 RepID=A0A923PL42_9BACT|nr:Na+/H+ antiporter NhaC family protein [Neolewinella lacunae]MBC6996045.1 sodium:solute symporter [Neolewinella lacunae]MDN3635434.1 Na+/H+ antiporter NhaC family protein [Neolewinella lacunae]
MADQLGFLTLLPPVIAILLAIGTRQVFISLLAGIFLGYVILMGGNPWLGFLETLQGLVDVFADAGNTRTIMFCALVGGLIVFMQRSGGVAGFIVRVERRLARYENRRDGSGRVVVQLLAWLTGALVFVESSISVLTVGTLYRPIFDKLGISREKLAYIADSSSAPSSILIPFNGWGAFIMTLLAAEGFANPFGTMIRALGYNFYAMLALFMVPVVILLRKDFGPMRRAETRTAAGQLLSPGATPVVDTELTDIAAKEGVVPRARNMIVPIVVMVIFMPFMLAYTGWSAAREILGADAGAGEMLFQSIGSGSGSTAVLTAVTLSLLVSIVFYKAQGIFGLRESVDLVLKGIAGLMPLALLMLLAFAIGTLCKKLETGIYVADVAQGFISPGLVPFLVFLATCFIAFSTGTSWGTFAIMIPIAVPMARDMDANVLMAIAAVLGGGVFGDHCSPISDTTILSSMASATDHVDHVKTQLPYAGIAGGIAALVYLVLGVV